MSNPGSSRSMIPSEKVPWVGQSQPRKPGRAGQPGLALKGFRIMSFPLQKPFLSLSFPPN